MADSPTARLRRTSFATSAGVWRVQPPEFVLPGAPHQPEVAVFASESSGAGTDAWAVFAVDVPRGGPGGAVASAAVKLRWVNPRVSIGRVSGRWVEVQTTFDAQAFAELPGLVVHWDEPEQRDHSCSVFRVELQAGAGRPFHYDPSAPDFQAKRFAEHSPLPPLPCHSSARDPDAPPKAVQPMPPNV